MVGEQFGALREMEGGEAVAAGGVCFAENHGTKWVSHRKPN